MDFWYESSQEQLILLAVSQTSCTTGSSCTITTFSARRTSDLVVTIVRNTATRGAGVGVLPAGGELGAAALGGDGEAVGGRPAPRLEVPGGTGVRRELWGTDTGGRASTLLNDRCLS